LENAAYEPASRSLRLRAQKMHFGRHLGLGQAERYAILYSVLYWEPRRE
jgi:hypothetical protein